MRPSCDILRWCMLMRCFKKDRFSSWPNGKTNLQRNILIGFLWLLTWGPKILNSRRRHPPISSYIHLNAPGAKQQPALATVCRWLGTSRFSTDARSSRFRRRRTGRAKQAALPKSSQGSCQVLALSRNVHIIHPLESTRLSEPWSCFTCRRLSCLFNNWQTGEVETVPPAFQKFANNMVSVPPVSASWEKGHCTTLRYSSHADILKVILEISGNPCDESFAFTSNDKLTSTFHPENRVAPRPESSLAMVASKC